MNGASQQSKRPLVLIGPDSSQDIYEQSVEAYQRQLVELRAGMASELRRPYAAWRLPVGVVLLLVGAGLMGFCWPAAAAVAGVGLGILFW